MKVTATIERITPATAKTYLERMCENRKPKEATIAMYANDMQSNNWLLTPQGIAFDHGERLFDGQHRMLAIIRSGVAVEMLVLRGFPRDQKKTRTMDAIDCGVQRNIGDRLKIAGHKLNTNLAAAVARRLAMDICGPNSRACRKISLATTTAILGVYRDEAIKIIDLLPAPWNEVASLLYGSGLRISEALQLRSKDLDSHAGTVTVRDGKGGKDRVTLLPQSIIPALTARYRLNRVIWEEDRKAGRPGVEVPDSVARKIPRAGTEWPWFWVFPAPGESTDPDSRIIRRHHRHEAGFAKALGIATTRCKINKRVTAHSFRHGFATSYLASGGTIQELKELMGHSNIQTTEIYLHCLPSLASRVSSPLDNIVPMFRKTG